MTARRARLVPKSKIAHFRLDCAWPIAVVSIFQGIERANADRSIRDRMVQSAQALAGTRTTCSRPPSRSPRHFQHIGGPCGDAGMRLCPERSLGRTTYFSNLMRIDRKWRRGLLGLALPRT